MSQRLDGIGGRRKSAVKAPPPKTSPNRNPRPNNKVGWLTMVIALAIVAGAFYFYYQSQLVPVPVASNSKPTSSQSPINAQADTGSPLTNDAVTVNIYDSGAGAEALQAAITAIEQAGYSPKSLANSQLKYDKTYIWYGTGFEADAKKIAAALTGRDVVTSQTKISGAFDILIYLGKK